VWVKRQVDQLHNHVSVASSRNGYWIVSRDNKCGLDVNEYWSTISQVSLMNVRSSTTKLPVEPGTIAAMSRLFSSGVIREMARTGRSPLFARLAIQSKLADLVPASECVSALFDIAFSVLKQAGLRDEYVYKSALTHKILLGRHSLRTACMLSEFRVGDCKADVVILNGTSTVYEVKSERDSLQRLVRQVAAYRTVFARVCVVASESHVSSVVGLIPEDVGILCLNRRHNITTVREADDRPDRTSAEAIFNSLRTREAQLVLSSRGISIPQMPNTMLHSKVRSLFVKLSPRDAHLGMVDVLKKTRNLIPLSTLVSQLPTSLHMAALSVPLRRSDHSRLVAAVNTRLEDAVDWD